MVIVIAELLLCRGKYRSTPPYHPVCWRQMPVMTDIRQRDPLNWRVQSADIRRLTPGDPRMKRSTFPGIATLSLACIAAVAAPQRAPARDVNPLDPLDWLQEQEITADDGAPNAEFGVAVALHGTTAMVGAQQANIGANEDQGAVYVFDQSGSGWTQSQKLTSDDGAAFDTFGDAVAFQGDTAIVGAYAATVNNFAYQGAAYVFTRSNGTWSQAQKLAPDDGT
ncbi:MAG TPA: FG-GAP repeat protein, partial [Rhodanobacteraceae bacterium]|nr:FG-GAP repeat protein [Rhodanobacteraceae bacterium]